METTTKATLQTVLTTSMMTMITTQKVHSQNHTVVTDPLVTMVEIVVNVPQTGTETGGTEIPEMGGKDVMAGIVATATGIEITDVKRRVGKDG